MEILIIITNIKKKQGKIFSLSDYILKLKCRPTHTWLDGIDLDPRDPLIEVEVNIPRHALVVVGESARIDVAVHGTAGVCVLGGAHGEHVVGHVSYGMLNIS